jgi:plasmid stabilization system protein ParE
MKIRFSRLAVYKLEKLSEYLIEEWSEQSNLKFLKQLDSKVKTIQKNPELFPQSQLETGLRKCVVTKQTSLLYEIQTDSIFILTLIDTRQDQKKMKEEVKKHFAQHRL